MINAYVNSNHMHLKHFISILLVTFCILSEDVHAFSTLPRKFEPLHANTYSSLVAQQKSKLQMINYSLLPPLMIKGTLGRLRPNREINDQSKLIEVGDIPSLQADVVVLSLLGNTNTDDGNDIDGNNDDDNNKMIISSAPATIDEVINIKQNKKVLLFGMPGAFTPTCTREHFPGIINNQNIFYDTLGFGKIIVITTNDKFVNEEWGKQLDLFSSSEKISLVSDADGDFIKSLGLMDDMGFGMSTRSKRFAIVLEQDKVEVEKNDNDSNVANIVVKNLFIDEGMDDCVTTSAQNIIQVLTPKEEVGVGKNDKYNSQTYPLLAAATVLLGIVFLPVLSSTSNNNVQEGATTTTTRVFKGKRIKSSDSNTDSIRQILDEYKNSN